MEVITAKKLLRNQIQTVLKAVSASEIASESRIVEKSVVSADYFKTSKRISVYVSTKGEIVTDGIIKAALTAGKNVFIPWFTKDSNELRMLRLLNVTEFEDLKPALWGIRQFETDTDHEPYESSGPLDLVLLPGVAFTRHGHRLGHGKGYYDRFLYDHKHRFGVMPKRIGFALTTQVIDFVPTAENDVQLDCVVSMNHS